MKKLLTLLIAFLALGAAPSYAQRVNQIPGLSGPISQSEDRIAAIVNDNVITTSDIEARMKLAFLSSGLPDSPEVRSHILPQILRSLIDEQLQMQEAKRLDITVNKEEIDKTMDGIARDNHLPTDMRTFLKAKGGSPEALEQQIRSGLAWNKVVSRELRSRVDVGDDEVAAAIARVRANAGKQEFLVSEIFLAVDNAKDEDQVKNAADNLVQQIKSGANFANVARQFSQSTGAGSGGDIGWIQQGQLPTELDHALAGMQTGEIAGPIRSSSGYHILALREKRTIKLEGGSEETVDLQQAFRPLNNDMDAATKEAQQIRSTIKSCSTLAASFAKDFPAWHLQSTDGMKLSAAPSWLADKVRDLPVGKASETMNMGKGLVVVFVCGHHTTDTKQDRDAIMQQIGSEKLELQARRLQRDLRRAAYIDIRLGKAAAN